MHPMERLRHVAMAGATDPALVVAETVEAIARLRPDPAELVNVCRQLVLRNPSCGPLWWLGAHLLHDGAGGERLWRLAAEIDDDPTPDVLAAALPEGVTAMVVGRPELTGRALARRTDVGVLAVDAGDSARFAMALERAGSDVSLVEPAATMAAMASVDVAIVEVGALGGSNALAPMGSAVLALVAGAADVPVWVVAGRGRCLPQAFLDVMIVRAVPTTEPWESAIERIDLGRLDPVRDHLAGPRAVTAWPASGPSPECPFTSELLPPC